jgi:anti-sigma regulatory factor (Ser/Thr protein kinase)
VIITTEQFEGPGSTAVVRLSGELDMNTAPVVRRALLKCLTARPDLIAVDVSEMSAPNDVVLSLFPAIARHAAAWPGSTLALIHSSPALSEALERTAVSRYVPMYPSVAAAASFVRSQPAPHRLRDTLAPTSDALAAARTLVAEACRAWKQPAVSDVAQLIVTELVGNAVRHAGTPIELTVALRRRYMHVAVRDQSPRLPRLGGGSPDADGGRGLIVVEALAASWGTTRTDDGKVVWATLPLR